MPTEAVALQSLFPGQSLGHAHQAQQNLESALRAAGLPSAPTIPQSVDQEIREQIQRTIHIEGLNPQVSTNAKLLEYMQEHAGEVKYCTFAGEGDFVDECEAFVEFADIKGVIGALKLENPILDEKPFKVSIRWIYFLFKFQTLDRNGSLCDFEIDIKTENASRGGDRNCRSSQSKQGRSTRQRLLRNTNRKFRYRGGVC